MAYQAMHSREIFSVVVSQHHLQYMWNLQHVLDIFGCGLGDWKRFVLAKESMTSGHRKMNFRNQKNGIESEYCFYALGANPAPYISDLSKHQTAHDQCSRTPE